MFGRKEEKELLELREANKKGQELVEELEERIKDQDERIKELVVEIRELKHAEIEIKKDYQRKEEHATALMKVKTQEEITKAVNKVKDEYAVKERELLDKNFEKLSTSMTKLHEEGNRNSQYQEKMTLKMMDVIGSISSGKSVDSSKLIEGGSNVGDENWV